MSNATPPRPCDLILGQPRCQFCFSFFLFVSSVGQFLCGSSLITHHFVCATPQNFTTCLPLALTKLGPFGRCVVSWSWSTLERKPSVLCDLCHAAFRCVDQLFSVLPNPRNHCNVLTNSILPTQSRWLKACQKTELHLTW